MCVTYVQYQVYGSKSYVEEDFSCSMEKQRECIIGDLTRKCGPLNFENRRAHVFCTDSQLGTISRSQLFDEKNINQRLIVRIGQSNGSALHLGCAALNLAKPRTATARFRTSTITGDFHFYQDGPDDRTYIRPYLIGLNRRGPFSLRIFQGMGTESDPCNATLLGNVISRPGGAFTNPVAMGGIQTSDSCVLGNLDAILPIEDEATSLRKATSTSNLPLFGPYSIIGRTIALVRADNTIAACGPIECPECSVGGRYNSLLGYQELNNPPLN